MVKYSQLIPFMQLELYTINITRQFTIALQQLTLHLQQPFHVPGIIHGGVIRFEELRSILNGSSTVCSVNVS